MRRTIPPLIRSFSLVAAVLFSGVAARAAEVHGKILGEGAKPIAAAVVYALPDGAGGPKPLKAGSAAAHVETTADGVFALSQLAGDSFCIRVEAKGYAPLTQPQIPAGATVQLRLRAGAKVSGVVKDRVKQTPVAGVAVLGWEKEATPFGEGSYRKATTGKDGRFVIEDLAPDKTTIEARAKGFAPARTPNVVAPKADVVLLLDIAGGVSGSVVNTVGDPIAGAVITVSLGGPTGTKTKTAKTGADGHYRIPDAEASQVTRMMVKAEKFLLEDRAGAAPSDGVVDFTLQRGGSIGGTVHGYDGKLPPTFEVKVRPGTHSTGKSHAEKPFTDPSGTFRVDDLEPGTYTIEIAADRYASITKEDLVVSPEQVTDAGTLTLQSRSVLRGRVVSGAARTPVAGAAIQITLVDGGLHADPTAETSWSATSAPDGTFKTPALPAGSFDLTVSQPQFAPAHTRVAFQPDVDAPEIVIELGHGGALTGSVVDAKQEPVANVRIVANQGTDGDSRIADTGSDGHYFMDGLAAGTWTVTRQQDRATGSASVDSKYATITEGQTTEIDFDEKPRVTVSGMLMKGDAPIPNAPIYFVSIDNNLAHDGKQTQSDASGAFQIGLIHGGKYQVSVVFGGAANATGHNVVTLTIPDQTDVHQDIVFTVHAITGHVHGADRQGVKGAQITALRDGSAAGDAPRQATTLSLDDGSFKIDAVDPGTYRVTARAKSYTSGEEYPVLVSDDQRDPDLDLTLNKGWIMRGHVIDASGRGVIGALIVVAPAGAAESGFLPSQTDASGAFRVTAPSDGPCNVAAISAQYAPAVQTDVDQPPDESQGDVVLHPTVGGSLRVRVVHKTGDPMAGAQIAYQPVTLFPGSDVSVDRNRPAPTDADGSTVVMRLYPGAYMVTIPGRRDVTPAQVYINEGGETATVLEVP